MRKKKFLALMMAMAIVGAAGVPAITVEAQGLGQIQDASKVPYGSLTKEDKNIVKELFDFEFYKAENPDVVAVVGDNYDDLFKHFCLCGIFEGRTCNPNFDPSAYASANPDLAEKFGANIISYYKHYELVGSKEDSDSRKITTMAACAEAGITFQSLVSSEIRITPTVYAWAQKLHTNDFATVQKAVNKVVASGTNGNEHGGPSSTPAVVSTSQATYLLVPERADAEAYAKAKGFTKVDTITIPEGTSNTYLSLYVFKGQVGHAVYENWEADGVPVYKTDDFVAAENMICEASIGVNVSSPITDEERSVVDTEVDHTGASIYSPISFETTIDDSGNYIWSTVHVNSSDKETKETETATNYFMRESILSGYHTNYSGSESYTFANDEERDAYIAKKKEEQNYEPAKYDSDYEGVDANAPRHTTYDVSINLEENADGSLSSISVGVSNDEHQFGYVNTTTVSGDKTENAESDNTESSAE